MKGKAGWLPALVLLIVSSPVSFAQEDAKYKELPNFHKVNANLFRGAQPEEAGIQKLKELGVKTIINLRDDDERARVEGVEAVKAGLRYFNIPLSNFDRPADKTVEQVLALIRETSNQPIFLHCKRGSDRTGMIVAVYRIEYDGWTSAEAKDEAKRYGLGFWQVGMKDYIHDYYKRRTERTTSGVR
jgi:tyrosine-protein phosphatase SIW14